MDAPVSMTLSTRCGRTCMLASSVSSQGGVPTERASPSEERECISWPATRLLLYLRREDAAMLSPGPAWVWVRVGTLAEATPEAAPAADAWLLPLPFPFPLSLPFPLSPPVLASPVLALPEVGDLLEALPDAQPAPEPPSLGGRAEDLLMAGRWCLVPPSSSSSMRLCSSAVFAMRLCLDLRLAAVFSKGVLPERRMSERDI
jgi:hypothetical protein